MPSRFDAVLFHRRHQPGKVSPEYGWPVRLICCIYVSMFFASAVTKLINSGIAWGFQALPNILYRFRLGASSSHLAVIDFALNHLPLRAVGIASHLLELAAPLALLRGLPRLIILPLLISMQLMIYYIMALDFRPTFALIPFFVPWSRLRQFVFDKETRPWWTHPWRRLADFPFRAPDAQRRRPF
jgi:hypothetical protein